VKGERGRGEGILGLEDRSEKFREAITRGVDIGTADKNDKVSKLSGSPSRSILSLSLSLLPSP